MKIKKLLAATLLSSPILAASVTAHADENLFGYAKGAETMPAGAYEFDQQITWRGNKGVGTYNAWDSKSEIEYGVTDKFNASA